MPRQRDRKPKQLLSALVVLCVVFLSVAQVNAVMAPGGNVMAAAMTLPSPVHRHASASVSSHDQADAPCKGDAPAHSPACCQFNGCPVLALLPPSAPMPSPIVYGNVSDRRIASAFPEGIARTPDLPPPRSVVRPYP